MSRDLADLNTKYPTAYGRIHFECDVGWYDILDELGAVLERQGAVAGCAKQKFGGLRVYLDECPDDAHDAVYAAIDAAEDRAWKTCEACGEPGKRMKVDGWVQTLCMECGE